MSGRASFGMDARKPASGPLFTFVKMAYSTFTSVEPQVWLEPIDIVPGSGMTLFLPGNGLRFFHFMNKCQFPCTLSVIVGNRNLKGNECVPVGRVVGDGTRTTKRLKKKLWPRHSA